MANNLYNYGRNGFLTGAIDWSSINLRIILLNSGYKFGADDGYADITSSANVIAYSDVVAPATPDNTDGYANINSYTFDDLIGPYLSDEENTIRHIIIAEDVGGGIETCILLAYLDSATGLPQLANGDSFIFTGVSTQGYSGVLFRL